MVDNQRLIGEFLRAKREQISPAMVGLPQPKRSRTRGLRREDVAELSGISTVWYSKIERGQAAGISPQVLSALSQALQLNPSEHEYLSNLCSLRNPCAHKVCQQLVPETKQLMRQLTPLPALLINAHLDIIATNEAFDMMAGLAVAQLPAQERNYLYLTINHKLWQQMVSIQTEAQLNQQIKRMAGFLRDSLAKYPADEALKKKVEYFRASSAVFESAWTGNNVLAPEDLCFTHQHALLGPITLIKKIWWNFSGDSSSRLNLYHPQTEHDFQRLAKLFQ